MLADLLKEQYVRQENSKTMNIPGKKIAWERFCQEIRFPNKKTDGFEYLPLEQLNQSKFFHNEQSGCIEEEVLQQSIYPECENSYIVIFNGKLCLELSSLPVDVPIGVSSLGDAQHVYGSYLRGRWQQQGVENMNPFALLNLALFEEGVFLHIPKMVSLKTPLQIIHIISGPYAIYPKLHIYMGKDSSAFIATNTIFLSEKSALVNEHIDVLMEEGSSLNMIDALWKAKGQFYFSSVHASVKQNANFKHTVLTGGACIHRKSYDVALKGEGANCLLKGLLCLRETHGAHVHAIVKHEAPHTTSNQHFKSMLHDRARSSFDGKIHVERSALLTEAYQLNNNLLLSEHAVAFSKPNLEIFADDVKASHGCTTAQINEEELFYLLSRGLSKQDATNLLTKAFAKEIIQEIPLEGIQNAAKCKFDI